MIPLVSQVARLWNGSIETVVVVRFIFTPKPHLWLRRSSTTGQIAAVKLLERSCITFCPQVSRHRVLFLVLPNILANTATLYWFLLVSVRRRTQIRSVDHVCMEPIDFDRKTCSAVTFFLRLRRPVFICESESFWMIANYRCTG